MPLEVVKSEIPQGEANHDEIVMQLADGLLNPEDLSKIPKDQKDADEFLDRNWLTKKGIPDQIKDGLLNPADVEKIKAMNPSQAREELENNRWARHVGIPEQVSKGILSTEKAQQLKEIGGSYAKQMLKLNERANSDLKDGFITESQLEDLWEKGPEFGMRWLGQNRRAKESILALGAEGILIDGEREELWAMDPRAVEARISQIQAREADKELSERIWGDK